ncbi:MAG: hypothetical protein K1W21_19665 [Oscillospiraceae bacterium]
MDSKGNSWRRAATAVAFPQKSEPILHVAASSISLAAPFSKVTARSFRCSALPHRARPRKSHDIVPPFVRFLKPLFEHVPYLTTLCRQSQYVSPEFPPANFSKQPGKPDFFPERCTALPAAPTFTKVLQISR